jgi:hypothetical protein
LRRRRRQSTQVFKKKNISSQKSPYYNSITKAKFNWKRWLRALFFIVIFAAISYFIYTFDYSSEIMPQGDQPVDTVRTTEPPVEESLEIEAVPPFEQNIQIEVLNGCGVNGIAKIFQAYLRKQGFDVVNTENYMVDGKRSWDIQQSMIIDHIGDSEQAQAIARSLGIAEDKIIDKKIPNPIYDMSVVIGKDYKNLSALQ